MKNISTKLRIKFWKDVLADIMKNDPTQLSGICITVGSVCNRTAYIDTFCAPLFNGLKQWYPEFYKYKPARMWAGTEYWFEPYSVEGTTKRINLIQNIIRDLEATELIEKKINLWKVIHDNIADDIEQNKGRNGSDVNGICLVLNKHACSHDLPDVHPETMKKDYPELYKHKPKTMFRRTLKPGTIYTNYWWAPKKRKNTERRLKVVNEIITDLKNQL